MEIKHNFSSPFAFFKNTDLLPELRKYIHSQNIEGIESQTARHVKKNLKESKFNLFQSDEIIIKNTMKFAAQSLGKFLNELHQEYCHYDISFNDSWFHIGSKNSVHEVHLHPLCSWCGIYYVDSGDTEDGDTVFCSPVQRNHIDFGTRYLDAKNQERIKPENGLLVLFPAYLAHFQSLYTGNTDRIVVAFNISVHGPI
tara:strand:- start:5 stop:598 length:594 start_codon:yes stop_codon:yes gene_type:complete